MENKLMMALGLDNHKFKEGMNEAKKMTGELGEKFKEMGLELASALGIGFAAFKGFELIKEGMEEFKKINIQSALLTNELKNQGKYSKELVDNLKEGRELLSSLGYFKEGEQLIFQREMEKQFPNANNEYRNQYTLNAANIAAASGKSLQEAQSEEDKIISLRPSRSGKELPQLKAMLSEFGVDFWEKNQKAIMLAASHGQNSYVNFMTDLLSRAPGLNNAAKTAAENNPDIKFNKAMEEFTVHLGELGMKIKKAFLPDMEAAVKWMDDLISNHFDQIKNTVVTIGHGLEFVATHIELLGIAFAAKKLYDGISWITSLFSGSGEKMSATALMTVNAEVVNVNGAMGLGSEAVSAGETAEVGAVGGMSIAALSDIVVPLLAVAGVVAAVGALASHFGIIGTVNSDPDKQHEINEASYKAQEEQANTIRRGHMTSAEIAAEDAGKNRDTTDYSKIDYSSNTDLSRSIQQNTKETAEAIKKSTPGPAPVTTTSNRTNAHIGSHPNSGVKDGSQVSESSVKGVESRNIIVNIKELVHEMKNTYTGVAESAKDIERIVTQAIEEGIMAGEMLAGGNR